jgi:UDP:flavonoid glycosyltransferase YjiC (YdhE family)
VAGSDQHLFCLLPLARAAIGADDDVLVASGPDRANQVASHGLAFAAVGPDFQTLVRTARNRFPDLRLGGEHEESDIFTQFFARIAAPASADDLVRLVGEWAPDLVVHEPADLAAPLAARARGIPWATHDWGLPIPAPMTAAIGAAVASMWRAYGLAAPRGGGLYHQLHLQVGPTSLGGLGTAPPPAPTAHWQPIRPEAFQSGAGAAPWNRAKPSSPVVHVCLGSAGFNQAFALLRFVVAALARDEVTVIVTVGRGNDRLAVGGPWPNVVVEHFIPHAQLMPVCSVVVTHGGSGTVLSALQYGVPMLVLPLGADQFRMADAVTARGAGLSRRGTVTSDDLRAAVRELLADGSYRRAANEVAQEIRAMPSASEALAAVKERLTAPGER